MKTKQQIINTIKENTHLDNKELAKMIGITAASVRRYKRNNNIVVNNIVIEENHIKNNRVSFDVNQRFIFMEQLVEMVVEKFAPALYTSLGIFLPLIAVNCAILGGSLFMQEREYETIWHATSFGLGSGVGFLLAIVGIAAIREKIRYSNVPPPLRGLGITFIITGLMGIAFMSFLGIKL